MKNKIKFKLCDKEYEGWVLEPAPAAKMLPDWYKEMNTYHDGKFSVSRGTSNSTAKRCVPLYDALSSGYVLRTNYDVYVDEERAVSWGVDYGGILLHQPFQVNGMTLPTGFADTPVLKWPNPYNIYTPKGYSTLFIPPTGHDSPAFTTFPAIVDTDKWDLPIHFPFVLKEGFVGTIPRGTPIVQMIPFKRDSWEMSVENDDYQAVDKRMKKHFTYFINHYRRNFWQRKEYK